MRSGRDARAAPRAPAARGPKRRFLTPARSRGAPWARSQARGGVGAWALETPVISADESAARVAFVSSGRGRLFIEGRARARTRTSSPKRDPKRPAQRTPPRSATPASAPPRDTPRGELPCPSAHAATPGRAREAAKARSAEKKRGVFGVLGGAPAGHRRRPATKLGVRAGLGVGGTGRGARVGRGAPAGRAGGGKGRNLIGMAVLARADHPSGGRMGLSAIRYYRPSGLPVAAGNGAGPLSPVPPRACGIRTGVTVGSHARRPH